MVSLLLVGRRELQDDLLLRELVVPIGRRGPAGRYIDSVDAALGVENDFLGLCQYHIPENGVAAAVRSMPEEILADGVWQDGEEV